MKDFEVNISWKKNVQILSKVHLFPELPRFLPSIFFHLIKVGLQCRHTKQGIPDVLLHNTIFQLLLENPGTLAGLMKFLISLVSSGSTPWCPPNWACPPRGGAQQAYWRPTISAGFFDVREDQFLEFLASSLRLSTNTQPGWLISTSDIHEINLSVTTWHFQGKILNDNNVYP